MRACRWALLLTGRAGFLHDMGEDGSGPHSIYLRRGARYYIDVGAS